MKPKSLYAHYKMNYMVLVVNFFLLRVEELFYFLDFVLALCSLTVYFEIRVHCLV